MTHFPPHWGWILLTDQLPTLAHPWLVDAHGVPVGGVVELKENIKIKRSAWARCGRTRSSLRACPAARGGPLPNLGGEEVHPHCGMDWIMGNIAICNSNGVVSYSAAEWEALPNFDDEHWEMDHGRCDICIVPITMGNRASDIEHLSWMSEWYLLMDSIRSNGLSNPSWLVFSEKKEV